MTSRSGISRGLQPLKEIPTEKKPLDDSSEGVDDFRAWSYFKQNSTKLKIFGHSSAWCPKFAEEVRHQRFYQMDAPLVVRKKKTPSELAKEQEELNKRAKQQLQRWLEGPDDNDKNKRDRKKGRKNSIFRQANGRKANDGTVTGSDAESDADVSSAQKATQQRRGSFIGKSNDIDSDLDHSRVGKNLTGKKQQKDGTAVASTASPSKGQIALMTKDK